MKLYLKLILIPLFLKFSNQIQNDLPHIKGCPIVKLLQQNISIDLINGTWYEISKDESSFRPGKCVTAEIVSLSSGNMSVTYTQIFDTGVIRSNMSVSKFNATMVNPQLWAAKYNSLYITLDGFFYILDTDYNYYAVILGCGKIRKTGFNKVGEFGHMVWILSRTYNLDQKYLTRAYDTLSRNHLPTKTLRSTDQNCSRSNGDIK